MAYQNRVVSLLTDDKCKFTHVRLANKPTSVVVGPRLSIHRPPITSVFTPDGTKVHIVKCPHPEAPPTDPGDNPVPIPNYLYVSYEPFGAPLRGKVYRYPYDADTQTLGTGELLITQNVNTSTFHFVVDEENNVIIIYEVDSGVTDTYLRKYNATTGVLLAQKTYDGTAGFLSGLDIARSSQLVATCSVSSPADFEGCAIFDYDLNFVRTIDLRSATKTLAPHFSLDETMIRWFHWKNFAILPDEDRLYEAPVDGSGVADEIGTGFVVAMGGASGEQHTARNDSRDNENLGFVFGPGNDSIYTYQWDNPGSLSQIANPSFTPHQRAFDVNRHDERVTYPDDDQVNWVEYNGADDVTFLDPDEGGTPSIRAVAWGY